MNINKIEKTFLIVSLVLIIIFLIIVIQYENKIKKLGMSSAKIEYINNKYYATDLGNKKIAISNEIHKKLQTIDKNQKIFEILFFISFIMLVILFIYFGIKNLRGKLFYQLF